MQHIQGEERSQATLFPDVLDDYLAQDNPVRFLDAFVDALDLAALAFTHAVLKDTGRPPYHVADLLKLYVYGYLNRLQSTWTNGSIESPVRERSRAQPGTHVVPQASYARL